MVQGKQHLHPGHVFRGVERGLRQNPEGTPGTRNRKKI